MTSLPGGQRVLLEEVVVDAGERSLGLEGFVVRFEDPSSSWESEKREVTGLFTFEVVFGLSAFCGSITVSRL